MNSENFQNIENLTKDSEFVAELLQNWDGSIEDIGTMTELASNEEFQLLDKFYDDYMQFDEQQSLKVIDLLNRLKFKQCDDFVFLTIVKFNLTNFSHKSYPFDYLFETLRKNSRPFDVAVRHNFNLTAKWLVKTGRHNLTGNLVEFVTIAAKNGNVELLEFFRSYGDDSLFSKITKENIVPWKFESLKWAHEHEMLDQSCYNEWFRIVVQSADLENVEFVDRTGRIDVETLRSYAMELSRDEEVEIMEYFHGIVNFSDNECIYMFENRARTSLELLSFLYNDGRIPNEIVVKTFERVVTDTTLLDLEIPKFLYKKSQDVSDIAVELGFYSACKNSNFLLGEWIFSLGRDFSDDTINESFYQACSNSNERLATLIYQTGRVSEYEIETVIENLLHKSITVRRILENLGLLERMEDVEEIEEDLFTLDIEMLGGNLTALKIMEEYGQVDLQVEKYKLVKIITSALLFENFDTLEYIVSELILSEKDYEKMILTSYHRRNKNFIRFYDRVLKVRSPLAKVFKKACLRSDLNCVKFLLNFKTLDNDEVIEGYKHAIRKEDRKLLNILRPYV